MADSPRDPDKPIIALCDLHKSFGSLKVLTGVSLELIPGRTTVILGPSGCGKSVLLKHIVGLLRPDRGEVYFDNQRIDRLSEHRLVPIRMNFGYLFQMGALFDSMTVEQNVRFPLEEHSTMSPAEKHDRCAQVLDMVGLADTAHKMPAELSGGQRKRIALARAVVLHPRVVLYDEPTTGLDPMRCDVINELILKLQSALHVTSIVVTHDMTSAFRIADRMIMLYEGRFIFDGTPDEIRQTHHPAVRNFIEGKAAPEDLEALGVTR